MFSKYTDILRKIKRDFFSDEFTILSRDLIDNMDHMFISVTEHSSVILSQPKIDKKLKVMPQKCLNKLKPRGMV